MIKYFDPQTDTIQTAVDAADLANKLRERLAEEDGKRDLKREKCIRFLGLLESNPDFGELLNIVGGDGVLNLSEVL